MTCSRRKHQGGRPSRWLRGASGYLRAAVALAVEDGAQVMDLSPSDQYSVSALARSGRTQRRPRSHRPQHLLTALLPMASHKRRCPRQEPLHPGHSCRRIAPLPRLRPHLHAALMRSHPRDVIARQPRRSLPQITARLRSQCRCPPPCGVRRAAPERVGAFRQPVSRSPMSSRRARCHSPHRVTTGWVRGRATGRQTRCRQPAGRVCGGHGALTAAQWRPCQQRSRGEVAGGRPYRTAQASREDRGL